MKVVLFCGGQGLRLRAQSEDLPKPMVSVGYRPILWHIMRYYAHFGHKDFILCLGYKADIIKRLLPAGTRRRSRTISCCSGENRDVDLLGRDIADWRITFVDTGLDASVGQRLRAVRRYVGDEPFLANYGDVLTDAPLDERVDRFLASELVASLMCVRPTSYSFHLVRRNGSNLITQIDDVGASDLWINGGYFIFRPAIFDFIGPGEDLIEEPFARLIAAGKLRCGSLRGLLGAAGHPQGRPAPPGRLRDRAAAVGSLASADPGVTRCGA